jgi:hypothetical protein
MRGNLEAHYPTFTHVPIILTMYKITWHYGSGYTYMQYLRSIYIIELNNEFIGQFES